MNTKDFGPVGADDGNLVRFGDAMTARILLGEAETGGSFSIVEHLLAPRELAAPLHMHSREDEYTIVVRGMIGCLLGDEVFHAGSGEVVRKPRDQWHTFWNAGDEPARVLEVISPTGFETYFKEIGQFFPDDAAPDLQAMAGISERYGLQMDFGSLPQLIERFGLSRPLEMDGTPPARAPRDSGPENPPKN